MRQHDVLGVADAQLVTAEALGKIRHDAHLVAGRIAWNSALGL